MGFFCVQGGVSWGVGINGETACPRLEGEQTCGRHREIDTIDPFCTSFPIDS
jgi:hypothetical protein